MSGNTLPNVSRIVVDDTIFNNTYDNSQITAHIADPSALDVTHDPNRSEWGSKVDSITEKQELQKQAEYIKAMLPEEAGLRDPNKMLSVLVTTVMLLASGVMDIPSEYLIWTEHYLKGVLANTTEFMPNATEFLQFVQNGQKSNPSPISRELEEPHLDESYSYEDFISETPRAESTLA